MNVVCCVSRSLRASGAATAVRLRYGAGREGKRQKAKVRRVFACATALGVSKAAEDCRTPGRWRDFVADFFNYGVLDGGGHFKKGTVGQVARQDGRVARATHFITGGWFGFNRLISPYTAFLRGVFLCRMTQ
jgi:hypothetical protein